MHAGPSYNYNKIQMQIRQRKHKNIVNGTPGLTISNGLRKLGTQYGIQEFRNRSVLVLKGFVCATQFSNSHVVVVINFVQFTAQNLSDFHCNRKILGLL